MATQVSRNHGNFMAIGFPALVLLVVFGCGSFSDLTIQTDWAQARKPSSGPMGCWGRFGQVVEELA